MEIAEQILKRERTYGWALWDLSLKAGPFVMNIEAEIHQAIQDCRQGKMGHLDAARAPA